MTAESRTVTLIHEVPDWSVAQLRERYRLVPFSMASESEVSDARVAVTSGRQRVDADLLCKLRNLEYLIAVGSGCEGIDQGYTAEKGIRVSNSASVTAEDVANHAVTITLALQGNILSLDQAVRGDRWHSPTRRSLSELCVGIVGLGAIGLAVASRFSAFGCTIRWTGPRPKESPYPYVSTLDALAEWADILAITGRADSTNVGIINRDVLSRLGPEGLLTNVSRGSIVDELALLAALRGKCIGGTALDVFAEEPTQGALWRDLSNVIVTPHTGGYTTGVRRGIANLVRTKVDAFYEGLSCVS